MKKLIIILTICFSRFSVFSQTILNGDFEANTAFGCKYNITNLEFNSFMLNCYAFGLGNELDIQKDTNNINTLNFNNNTFDKTISCSYSNCVSGNYFISISSGDFNKPDALSLELSSEYIQNNNYQIDFLYRNYLYMPIHRLDTLIFGVSNDSISFGETIFKLIPDTQFTWVNKSFVFNSPINARFLTLKNSGKKFGWNFVDNIRTYSLTNINNKIKEDIILFPNPSDKEITLSSKSFIENGEIIICNTLGKKVKSMNNLFGNKFIIESHDLPVGHYMISMLENNKTILNKRITIIH